MFDFLNDFKCTTQRLCLQNKVTFDNGERRLVLGVGSEKS